MINRLNTLLIACMVLISCSHKGKNVSKYFPLKLGSVWVYNLAFDGKPSGHVLQVLVSAVTDKLGEKVYIVSHHDGALKPEERIDQPAEYQLRKNGVLCEIGGGCILLSSLTIGQTWPGSSSKYDYEINRVISLNATIEVEGKRFEDCLIIEREVPPWDRRIEFVYAPNVGLIRSRFFKLSDPSAKVPVREEMLVEFGNNIPPRFLRPLK